MCFWETVARTKRRREGGKESKGNMVPDVRMWCKVPGWYAGVDHKVMGGNEQQHLRGVSG